MLLYDFGNRGIGVNIYSAYIMGYPPKSSEELSEHIGRNASTGVDFYFYFGVIFPGSLERAACLIFLHRACILSTIHEHMRINNKEHHMK